MSCEFVTNHLLYYLLGELSPRDRRVVEEHVPKCVVCSEALNAWARDITTITEAMKTTTMSPSSVADRVMARVTTEPLAARRPVLWRWRTLAVAAPAMVLVLIGLLWLGIWRTGPVSLKALEEDHDWSEEHVASQPLPTPTNDMAAQWLRVRSGLPFKAVDFSEHGAALAGAHASVHGRQAIAALLLQTEADEVSFYEFSAQDWRAPPSSWDVIVCPSSCKVYSGRVRDCNVVTWNDGELGYALVSCGDKAKLLELANHAISEPIPPTRRSFQ